MMAMVRRYRAGRGKAQDSLAESRKMESSPTLESTYPLIAFPPYKGLSVVEEAPKSLVAGMIHRHQGACSSRDMECALEWDAAAFHVRAYLTVIGDLCPIPHDKAVAAPSARRLCEEGCMSGCILQIKNILAASRVERKFDLRVDTLLEGHQGVIVFDKHGNTRPPTCFKASIDRSMATRSGPSC